MTRSLTLPLLLAACCAANAQTAPKLEFEVASIKPAPGRRRDGACG